MKWNESVRNESLEKLGTLKILDGENLSKSIFIFIGRLSGNSYVPLFKILEKLTGKERRQNKFKPFCVLSIKQYILHSQ